jgi:hypothetical protein
MIKRLTGRTINYLLFLLLIGLFFSCSSSTIGEKNQDQGHHQYSIQDFFKNPEKARFQISPDGNYLSHLAPYQGRMNLNIRRLSENKSNY